MSYSKIATILILVILALTGLLVVFGYYTLLPKDPGLYFPDYQKQIAARGDTWKLGLFRPVFLSHYKKDGGSYIKVAYRDRSGKPRIMDVFVSGNLLGKNFKTTPLIHNETILVDVEDAVSNYDFSFAEKINIEYVAEARKITDEMKREDCLINDKSQMFCQKIEMLIDKNISGYSNFSKEGIYDSDIPFIAYGFFKDREK